MGKVIAKALLPIALIILVLLGAAVGAQTWYKTQLAMQGTNTKQLSLTISNGESVQQIASDLVQNGAIGNTFAFTTYLKLNGYDKTVEVGTYLIPAKATILQIAHILQRSNNTMNITIREGLRIEEQADSIDQQLSVNNPNKQFDKNAYISLAKNPQSFTYPFISPSTTTLEGFLFPDTYQVEKTATAKDILTMMLDNFNAKIYAKYNQSNANGLNFYQNLILASILEREAKTDYDKKIIAGILLKRLSQNYPLGVDSTIQYYLGYSQQEQTWWRQAIYQTQLDNDNPYNTRKNPGLPPTPICNPGEASIADELDPTATQYFFYISDKQGIIHYANNIDQQNANIQKYLD